MAAEIVVEARRGPCVETRHQVRVAVVDLAGRAVASFGDTSEPVPVRSTVKLLQALPLVRTGAAGAFQVTSQELALACGSHNGESTHATVADAWLSRLNLAESTLQCPAALPMVDFVAEPYLIAGGRRRPLLHNCSGKHLGFLTLALHLGADPATYLEVSGPIQTLALRAIEEACLEHIGPDVIAIDGCGAPAPCVSLETLARGLVSVMATATQSAERQLLDAIVLHPFLIAGSRRFDTQAIESTGGHTITKVGADGIHLAILRDHGLAVAVKAVDGSRVAAESVLAQVLLAAGAISEDSLPEFTNRSILGDSGKSVGHVRVVSSVAF